MTTIADASLKIFIGAAGIHAKIGGLAEKGSTIH
jgi:hypothetical protein